MKKRIHLLQVRHDLELRDAVVVERHAVEHRSMDVQVHHAGYERAAFGFDELGISRQRL
jgi:hypothetical protein